MTLFFESKDAAGFIDLIATKVLNLFIRRFAEEATLIGLYECELPSLLALFKESPRLRFNCVRLLLFD